MCNTSSTAARLRSFVATDLFVLQGKSPIPPSAIWGFRGCRLTATPTGADGKPASGERGAEHGNDGASAKPDQHERNRNADDGREKRHNVASSNRTRESSNQGRDINDGSSLRASSFPIIIYGCGRRNRTSGCGFRARHASIAPARDPSEF